MTVDHPAVARSGLRIGASVAAAGTAMVLLAGCAVWGPEGGPGGSGLKGPPAVSSAPAVDAVLGPDGVQRIDISAGDNLRFTPAAIRARPGIIELVFHNVGTVPHDMQLDTGTASGTSSVDNGEPGTGNLNGGQSGTVRVTISRAGSYPFSCLYHISSGMVGTLDVV